MRPSLKTATQNAGEHLLRSSVSKLSPAVAGKVGGVGLLTRFSAADCFLAWASPGLPVRRTSPGLVVRRASPGLAVRFARGGLELLLGILGPSRAARSTGGVGDMGRGRGAE